MQQPLFTLVSDISRVVGVTSTGIHLGYVRKFLEKPRILKSVLVSNPYGIIGRELYIEATVKGLSNSDGLDLEFWADTPSSNYEELAKIKTKKLSSGEEASYITKITPREEGYYTVYANLYDNGRRIDRDSETLWVEK